jgi:hypothetical protein
VVHGFEHSPDRIGDDIEFVYKFNGIWKIGLLRLCVQGDSRTKSEQRYQGGASQSAPKMLNRMKF